MVPIGREAFVFIVNSNNPVSNITIKDNKNENIEKIKEFVLSNKGQKIIEDTGYVGVK